VTRQVTAGVENPVLAVARVRVESPGGSSFHMELRTPVNARRAERHPPRLLALGGLATITTVSCRGTGGARVVVPLRVAR
jgi:hypothetical protein